MRFGLLVAVSAVVGCVTPVFGGIITLGEAETFSVLGGSSVTNTGASRLRGNLGVSPGTSITGFPAGLVLAGAIHATDPVAAQAQADLTTAYNSYKALPCTHNLSGTDLATLTLTPGVYCFDTSAQLSGALILDFQSSTKADFVFQIGTTLTTASSSTVSTVNCTHHCAVNWQVGSSATLGTSTAFHGNILALASITLETNAHLCGRALAQVGAVTLDTNTVTFGGSLTPPPSQVTGNGQIFVPQSSVNEPLASGTGHASFAFISDPAGEGTYLDYLNSVTGLRIYGLIDNVKIIAADRDGSPKTVQFSGVCDNSLPQCSFSATVEQSTPSGGVGQFGVVVTGHVSEARSLRPMSSGKVQIQFSN